MSTILESKNDISTKALTDNEREMIHELRTLLLDLPDDIFRSLNTLVEQQRGERWTDQMLLVYLNYAVNDINGQPLATDYDLSNSPAYWKSCILLGAEVAAIFAQATLQVGESFSYADNGISLSISLAPQYQSLAQTLMGAYNDQKKNLKMYLRPGPSGIHSSPGVRVRSYAPRMWTYR
jgi:hypothetical protein